MRAYDHRKTRVIDFEVENHGSIWLFRPLTDAAREWTDEHVPRHHARGGDTAVQTWAGAVVVEHRYIGAIVQGAADAGLRVRVL